MEDIEPGFRFCPSDRVLLSYYLVKRLKGESTQFQIPDVDVYGIEPWSLFNDINDTDDDSDSDDDDEEEEGAMCSKNLIYVFTNIKKKHGNGSQRIGRTVTTALSNNQVIGTWKGQTKQKYIIDKVSKNTLGVKKMLSFMPALSKEVHDDDEGTNKNRKRKQITVNNNIEQLDGISYIMHEYSMAGSSYALCRIRRKICKSRMMNNKKMKYSSSCSRNISHTGWDDQGTEYDQPLQGRMASTNDDHLQMTMDTSVLLNHNQSSMLQQQRPELDVAEYDQQIQECMPQMMTNTSVLDHNQSSMWQQQQPDEDAEYGQQIHECMSQVMMNTSVFDHVQGSMLQQQQPDQDAEYNQQIQDSILKMINTPVFDHNQSSMLQQQQPDQDVEYDQQQHGRMPYDNHHQIMMNTSVLDHGQSSMWQQQQPDQYAQDDQDQVEDQLLQRRMTYSEMMNAPIVLDEKESSMSQQQQQQQQQPVQSEAGGTGGSPVLIDDDEDTGYAHLLQEDVLLDNTTSTSTSNGDEDNTTTTNTSTHNGDEDKTTGAGHEEVEEEDLRNQQQQQQPQPPAPTSEREDNLSLLSSIDFQSDDSQDFGGNFNFQSLYRFDEPLDIIPLWSY